MRAFPSAAAIAVAVATVIAAPARAQQTLALPTLIVSGEASVQAVPDMAHLRGGVTVQGKTAREASDANARAMTAVIAALKEAGIEEKAIATTRLGLQPVYEPTRQGHQGRIVAFQATNQVTVRLHAVERVAEMVDAMVGAGANEIGGVEFSVSDPSKLLDTARAAAVAEAKRKADLYAKAAGVGLGRIVGMVEEVSGDHPYARNVGAPAALAVPVMPGERTLRAFVTVTFQIVP